VDTFSLTDLRTKSHFITADISTLVTPRAPVLRKIYTSFLVNRATLAVGSSYPKYYLQTPLLTYKLLSVLFNLNIPGGVKVMNRTNINEQVAVTIMGFKKDLAAYPRRIVYEGATYDFLDAGLRCMVRQGERITEILNLSDGRSHFRLRSDNHGGNWTLLSITG